MTILIYLLSWNSIQGQVLTWLSEDSLDVGFGRISQGDPQDSKDGIWNVTLAKYVVVIKLSQDRMSQMLAWKRQDWIRLLQDKDTDFITNLLLYWKYERDASTIRFANSLQWREHEKKIELRYWRRNLPKK
jgi:hypothetical protein